MKFFARRSFQMLSFKLDNRRSRERDEWVCAPGRLLENPPGKLCPLQVLWVFLTCRLAEVSDRKVSPESTKRIEPLAEHRQSYNKGALINKMSVPVGYQAYVKYPTRALSQGGSGQIGLMPASLCLRSPKTKATGSFPGKCYRAHAPCVEDIGSVVST